MLITTVHLTNKFSTSHVYLPLNLEVSACSIIAPKNTAVSTDDLECRAALRHCLDGREIVLDRSMRLGSKY